VLERLSYDVWGQRRNANGTDDASYALKGNQDRTGYTGQEHLDELDLVHMNGRVYDPIIGRFTSADPNIPDPTNHQSFNRYSYVLNNPLNYTDPSGFITFAPSGFGFGWEVASINPQGDLGQALQKAADAARPVPESAKESAQAQAQKGVQENSCAGGADCNANKSKDIAPNAEKGGSPTFGKFLGELNPAEFARQLTRKLLDDFVNNNQPGSPDSNDIYRWAAVKLSGTYEKPDSTSANGVAALTAAAALPFLTGSGEVKLGKEGVRVLRELPALDATGKVHGILPEIKDLKRYDVDSLSRLRDELKLSVQRRIEVTVQKGSDFGHAER
jgi:RHS repeat-associated protein